MLLQWLFGSTTQFERRSGSNSTEAVTPESRGGQHTIGSKLWKIYSSVKEKNNRVLSAYDGDEFFQKVIEAVFIEEVMPVRFS